MAMAISLSEQDQQRDAEPEPKDDVGGFLSQVTRNGRIIDIPRHPQILWNYIRLSSTRAPSPRNTNEEVC